MRAERIIPCVDHFNGFCHLSLMNHVIDRIDYDSRTVEGIKRILAEIKKGITVAYGVFDKNKMIGVVFGPIKQGMWQVHIAFERHTKTLEGVKLVEDKAVKENGLSSIFAHIPLKNKAPQMLFRRLGAKKVGVAGCAFKKDKDNFEDCVILRKEY